MDHWTHQHTFDDVRALADLVIDAVTPKAKTHALLMDALLSAYLAVARTHSCCIQAAAVQCTLAALDLTKRAHQLPPDGAAIH